MLDSEREPLSWEYLFDALEHDIQTIQNLLEKDPDGEFKHRPTLDNDLGLYEILPRLQMHPILCRFIPYMGVLTFHWWPAEGFLLTLDCWQGRNNYHIALSDQSQTYAETIVSSDEVIPTLLDYLFRASAASGEV